jgi:hypothetical protein
MVSVSVYNKMVYLGIYQDFDEAVSIRLEAERAYYGENAPVRMEQHA